MKIKVGVIQSEYSNDPRENMDKVIHYLAEAKSLGAEVVCTSELFLNHYFCKNQDDKNFDYALPIDNPYLVSMKEACKKLGIVAPFSFFEKDGPHYYNSVIMIDANGDAIDIYRKSHLPDGPGYQEKYYFRPGNTGFKVFNTKYGVIGVGICWDQWFPEAARIMTLHGAELLLYPTAIGSEPNEPGLNTKDPWQRVMKGHAVANMIPVASANRLGDERGQLFYGASFVCDEFGNELLSSGDHEGVNVTEVDLEQATKRRSSFGFFRDRRVDLYEDLLG